MENEIEGTEKSIRDRAVEKWVQVKWHVERNKEAYIGTSLGVLVGAAGTVLILTSRSDVKISPKIQQILSYKPHAEQHLEVTLTERSNLSKPCKIKGSNRIEDIFDSQNDFARKYGVPKSIVSGHLNGKFPDIDGTVLEWIPRTVSSSQE